MAIKRLDHVSILAKDPQPVIAFYQDFLGFELMDHREIPGLHMTIFDLRSRHDFVEVIQPTGDTKQPDGIKHVAFLSDDIGADFDAFRKKGANLLHNEVQRYGDTAFFFVKAPTGEFVEIIQYGLNETY